jgi:hypothetical protein
VDYFLWVGIGTFEREWVWLQIAAEIKRAAARSGLNVHLRLRGWQGGPPTQAPAWLWRLLSIRPDNVFGAGQFGRSPAAVHALQREAH